ncbi:MAG: DNA replication and repair protein RecF, partial [Propionibacteriaceae bacterium]|nr:DNA replication and repair protein RecF [Propionibacteriaceae bacterium]
MARTRSGTGERMYVEHLSVTDFRNYAGADIELGPGVSVFTGPNGQGKTNLVEAVEYLATLSSHRAGADAPLIRSGADQAVVRARVVAGLDDARTLLLEIEINPGRANRAFINRVAQRSARELLGGIRVVMFTPDDLAIVKGDPADRRAFLDDLVTSRWPRMAGERSTYDRVIRQRNALLKSLAAHPHRLSDDDLATLEVWDAHLAQSGAQIMQARLETLDALVPLAAAAYADIAPTNADAGA